MNMIRKSICLNENKSQIYSYEFDLGNKKKKIVLQFFYL